MRTFHSRRFRLLVATMLAVFGVALAGVRLASFDPSDPSVLLDFPAYYLAAERMLEGASPYTAAQLDGTVPAYCGDCYLYPPFLAQVLAPITLVPLEAAKLVWVALTYVAVYASTWLAVGIGGAPRSLERALWCLVAVLLFGPVASAAWVGNVGGLVALTVTMVAAGGVAAGLGAGLGSLLKVAPATLAPAAFVADRRSRISLLVTLAAVAGFLFLLAPDAWLDYPVILLGVYGETSPSADNLAPAELVKGWGWGSEVVTLVRFGTLLVGATSIVISMWLARRENGMPAAALLGTLAMLVIPGALWYHYLTVLLPFAAMAWPRAGVAARFVLLAGAVAITSMTLAEDETFVYIGSAALLVTAGWVLWTRTRGRPATEVAAA